MNTYTFKIVVKLFRNPLQFRLPITLYFFLLTVLLFAQSDIPIGTWRVHASFNTINTVALASQKVFGASHNGIMILDKSDNSVSSYSKLDGLTGATITFINHDETTGVLLIAYEDGKFDVIDMNNEILTFHPTKNSSLTGSRKINHIFINKSLAYLAADYGVIVFDLTRLQVKETWRDLGATGEALRILQTTLLGDSIFMATEKGVLTSKLGNNLLDFNNWKRFQGGEFNSTIQSVASFNGKIYAAINNAGLFHYENGSWLKEDFLQATGFQSINSSVNNLLIAGEHKLWRLSPNNLLSQIVADKIIDPLFAMEDPNGKLWVGDGVNGLVSDASGSFVNYLPNGPTNESSFNLKFQGETIYALAGGYSSDLIALGNPGNDDRFYNGTWSTEKSAMLDLTDKAFRENPVTIYNASFGYGIEERDEQGNVKIWNENNSPLANTNPAGRFVNITALEESEQGLWVTNYDAQSSLHLLKPDNTWESFSFPLGAARYPLKLETDFYGSVWMVLNPALGGGVFVFNKDKNGTTYLTDVSGFGGLPSRSVHCMAIDRDGAMWVGTDLGIAYFINTSDVFSPGTDAIKPIFESRFLLKDDKVTAIAIDGGNRKWMGTERGVWLFSPTGEELIYNFTAENSPLLSNKVRDIEINHRTGEVFFATDQGLISFRADATESNNSFQSVKVFPNPVFANFVGTVGISGLATDAIVKITDISGKLIWQTQANGGTASWNVQDYSGGRAPTGIYIIFVVTQDGAENAVAKIAVVD